VAAFHVRTLPGCTPDGSGHGEATKGGKMPIRLKFKVVSLLDAGGGMGKTVNLIPVMEAPENQQHYRAQSGHMLAIGTLHNQSADTFETNREYWMEFTPADEEHHEEQPAPEPQQDRQEWGREPAEIPASRSARHAQVAHRASKVDRAPAPRSKRQSKLTARRSRSSVRR
jgi:hypothetical protein